MNCLFCPFDFTQFRTLFVAAVLLTFLGGCGSDDASLDSPKVVRSGALTYAVAKGDIIQVKELLNLGADLNEDVGDTGEHMTPIMVATALGLEEISGLLLSQGAVTYHTFDGYSARDFAFENFGDEHSIYRASLRN